MPLDSTKVLIYHITDIANLPQILRHGGLYSDARMVAEGFEPLVIGHSHIKLRRLRELRVPCCGNRFVGEFVPFYFCPRSPMLFTINMGNTGRERGCQSSIVHLVSSVAVATGLDQEWAFSNGNAGARYADFFDDLEDLEALDWGIIGSNSWGGDERRHKKAAEFLVADSFPWESIASVGCQNDATKKAVTKMISNQDHKPSLAIRTDWYYS